MVIYYQIDNFKYYPDLLIRDPNMNIHTWVQWCQKAFGWMPTYEEVVRAPYPSVCLRNHKSQKNHIDTYEYSLWCDKHIAKGDYFLMNDTFWFSHDSDFIAFRLAFSEQLLELDE